MSYEDPSSPPRVNKPRFRFGRIAIPVWRLGILFAACLCLHHAYQARSTRQSNQLEPA